MGSTKTKKEYLQGILNEFIKERGGDGSYEMNDVARWAIGKGLWDEPPQTQIRRCAKQLSEAAREEYHTDEKGRRVRSKHHYQITVTALDGTKKQQHLWADLKSFTPKQARLSFGQRRKQIEGECVQLNTDKESYNDTNSHNDQIMMSFDFTYCVEESSGNDDYDPS